MEEYAIRTEGLCKTYGSFFWKKKEPSLRELSLHIPKGVVFGFLGPNGAGKTTTIRLLMDLIKPSAGEAYILGKPAADVKIKHRIGFLPDAPAFSSYLSAYEFLNICAKLHQIPSAIRRQRIDEVLDLVNMRKHAKSKLGGFSRGMVQRIGIAQAIMNHPDLLILDEPLVGLDPHGRQELKNIIKAQKDAGTNVFFSSHILSDVEKMCDQIGILSQGRLLCCGPLGELLSNSGVEVKIKAGHDDLVKDLLPEATTTRKGGDGGWTIALKDSEAVKKICHDLEERYPDAVTVSISKENLEDFFFRQIETHGR